MSVRTNVAASILGQVAQVAMRLLVVPVFIHVMGIESYGLIGIYILFTALIQLFNFGLSSTMSREIARMRGGVTNAASIRRLLRRLSAILGGVSLAFAALVGLSAPAIVTHWLNVATLPTSEVVLCVRLMGAAAAMGFLANLYKAGLLGLERQIKLNALNTIFAAIRSLGVLPVLIWVSPTPGAFCTFQLIVAAIELRVVFQAFYRDLPPDDGAPQSTGGERRQFRRFAGGLALTDVIWAGVLQVDRVVLSGVLALSTFGYFTVIVTASSSVYLLFSPIAQAVQPRFAFLAAADRREELFRLYFNVTYGVTALLFSVAGVLMLFPGVVVFAWTGNEFAASSAGIVLPLYAAGNALVGVMSLPFLLQFALGDIRLHVIGHIAEALIYLPAAVWLARTYGMVGTGAGWLGMNLIYFLFLIPLIHRRVLPGQHVRWLARSVIPAAGLPLVGALLALMLPVPEARIGQIAFLSATCAAGLALSLMGSAYYREMIGRFAALHIFTRPNAS